MAASTSRSYASFTFCTGSTSTSAVMPCSAQKSSISCVSRMPPMSEPAWIVVFALLGSALAAQVDEQLFWRLP